MYGFLYGWVQKSFGHPEVLEIFSVKDSVMLDCGKQFLNRLSVSDLR